MRRLAFLFICSFVSSVAQAQTKVAIIDTGLDLADPRFSNVLCKSGHKDTSVPEGARQDITDRNGHGTHIAGLVRKHAGWGTYCLLIVKFFGNQASGQENLKSEVRAIEHAVREGATVINISAGGPDFSEDECLAIRRAPHVKFIVAAGNEAQNLDKPGANYFPASCRLPNIAVIGNVNEDFTPARYSNHGKLVDHWEVGVDVESTLPNGKRGRMSGTSQATAVATGKFLAGKLTWRRSAGTQCKQQNSYCPLPSR